MHSKLAQRMQQMRSSEIREILKVAVNPEIISLAGGLPAPETFPVGAISEAAEQVLAQEGASALQYSTTEGDTELRQWIASRMATRFDAPALAEEILITCGSQQGLDLIGKCFLDPGDVVLCESPTYLGAINALRAYEPRFVEVATDDEGMKMEALRLALESHPDARLIYVVPDFQNPSGRTWSELRRRGLLELAERFRVTVVEDAPYAELRFTGTPILPVKHFDVHDQVIYLGTFSKIFCPGLRLGWVAAPRGVLGKLVLAKQGVDLHTSTFSQRLVATYMREHDLDAAITRICEIYVERRAAMLDALRTHLPAGCRFTTPEGGLFVWAELPPEIDAKLLLERCIEAGVAFVPGGSFFPNGGHENTMRLNFSAVEAAAIREGIARIGRCLTQMLAEPLAPTLA